MNLALLGLTCLRSVTASSVRPRLSRFPLSLGEDRTGHGEGCSLPKRTGVGWRGRGLGAVCCFKEGSSPALPPGRSWTSTSPQFCDDRTLKATRPTGRTEAELPAEFWWFPDLAAWPLSFLPACSSLLCAYLSLSPPRLPPIPSAPFQSIFFHQHGRPRTAQAPLPARLQQAALEQKQLCACPPEGTGRGQGGDREGTRGGDREGTPAMGRLWRQKHSPPCGPTGCNSSTAAANTAGRARAGLLSSRRTET